MSVYIPKMKLPRNCGECPFFVDDGEFPFVEDGTWCGRANYLICDGIVNRDSKPEWCDLIPVPDHGRLIDADALAEMLEKYKKEYALKAKEDITHLHKAWGLHEAELMAESLPTIIPADHIGEANEMVADKEGEG